MKKILSIVLAVMMISMFALTSFAASESITINATEKDGVVTFAVIGTGNTFKTYTLQLALTGLTYVADSYVGYDGVLTSDWASSSTSFADDKVKIVAGSLASSADLNNTPICEFKYSVTDANWTADFVGTTSTKQCKFTFGTTTYNNKNNLDVISLNISKDEIVEEVFGITSTGSALAGTDTMKDENGENVAAAGDKVVAIFSKNVSDAELAAGSYGIIFGGVRYAGQAAVPAKTAWAIKLVGSAEQLPAGNYSYGVFAGDEVVNADSAWVIE